MEAHIASVIVVKPTVQELKVTGLKKPLQCFRPCMFLPPSYKQKKKVNFDRYNDPIIKCTHIG